MKDIRYHDYYKIVMRTMKRGEIAWVKFSRAYHKGVYHASIHYQNKTDEEKKMIGDDIWIRFQICNIKRNPQIADKETFKGVMEYYDTIREVCRELITFKEYANAQQLYERIMPMYKNMSKKMRDSLSPEETNVKNDCMFVLCLNLSHCHLKREKPNVQSALRFAREALALNDKSPKAHYRLAMAQKANGEFDLARESLLEAIKLAPNDLTMREEFRKLKDLKEAKHKEWYSKMSGFLKSEKMQQIEENEENEKLLKEKMFKKYQVGLSRKEEQKKLAEEQLLFAQTAQEDYDDEDDEGEPAEDAEMKATSEERMRESTTVEEPQQEQA